jgi:hypothetical protein
MMKIIATSNYIKIAKDKAEDFNVNPWAVCHTTVDEESNPEKYERCVKKVKQKSRKGKDTKDLSVGDMKPVGEGMVYTPATEDEWVEKARGKLHRPGLRPGTQSGSGSDWDDIMRRMRKLKEKKGSSSRFITIAETKSKKEDKWIQDAVKKPGSFTEYCKKKGYDGVTQECINEGKKSSDSTTKRRAELAETFRGMGKKKKDCRE